MRERTIFIVEDDREVLDSLVSVLESDAQIFVARNGYDALEEIFEIPRPDIIILDIFMPTMNGLEFIEAIQYDPYFNTIPIIIMTASNLKFMHYKTLCKPFKLEDLMDLIESES